ncbi:hypothetical protein DXG03_008980 [Asterophora parasitica]|uniref:TM7S3/TM198-like domain-containing protein n=1 Tax=Asterophora parasitica TaxID=117018 RepID=A0A9P7GBP2_9AGAR|nr:hypothetical protein DXG03_008980 [Asterophora parasitica]
MRVLVAVAAFLAAVAAQAPPPSPSPSPSPSPAPSPGPSPSSVSTPSPSLSLSLTTATLTATLTTRSRNQLSLVTSAIQSTFNVTHTVSPTSSAPSATTSAVEESPTPAPIVLATVLDPAFGVLGAILVITGLPSAFWGHKNRWTSFFLIGFYTLSLVCFVLILKFGILAAVNPPSKTLRGMFVLASSIAGIVGGGIAIFFWKAARYAIGAWGGFALGLWIQCFHHGGLIKPVGFRWILYMGSAIHYHILLISTAFVGSSAFMLGVDCFTTAGLKEVCRPILLFAYTETLRFQFYIWNLGFRSLFPKFTNNGIEFPVSQTMQIELGLIAAVALMGAAVQLRILSVLHRKLGEITEEQKKRDEEAEISAAGRFADVKREQAEWEMEHPTLSKHSRQDSHISNTLLMKDLDATSSPNSAEHRSSSGEQPSSTFTLVPDARARYLSNVSDFKAASTPDEELRRAARNLQSPGALPALDLGLGLQEDVPSGFIAADELRLLNQSEDLRRKDLSPTDLEEIRRKEELMLEIQTIRRSIDALKSETPAPSSSGTSRHPSMTSRRTLSVDAHSALLPIPSHLRPPRETDPRTRAHSMEMSSLGYYLAPIGGASISRPTSVPPRDTEWDAYVNDRRLLQPPAGVTPPIATTPVMAATPRLPIPPAVAEALSKRKQRESAIGRADSTDSSEDVPLAHLPRHQRSSSGGNVPVNILPPRRASAILAPAPQRPTASRTRTFEELNERHREKMRGLQAPLTQAEKDAAEVKAARQRWERNAAAEKEAMARRQTEKAAQFERERRKRSEDDGDRKRRKTLTPPGDRRHSRSLSHDRLGRAGPSSKRLSTLKVEDWQKYQQDTEMGVKAEAAAAAPVSSSRRESRAFLSPPGGVGVPFPDGGKRSSRRKSTDPLS